MSLDPLRSRPFGWGICLYTSDREIKQDFRESESISNGEEPLEAFIFLMSKFVTTLEKCFEYLAKDPLRACVFVYSEREKKTIRSSLLETMSSKTISSEIKHGAKRCLFNLFEDSSLLLVSRNNDDDDFTEFPNEWREFPRLIILEQAIRENIAINVPGFYRLIDIWEQLVKPKLKDQNLLNSLKENIGKIDLEEIYASWNSQERINKFHLLRIDFGNAVIKAYYELFKESTYDIASKLIFKPPIFTFTETKTFKNHDLGKLYFFKRLEIIAECKQVKSKRMKDFIQNETVCGIQLRFEKCIRKEEDLEWIVKFTILNGEKELKTKLFCKEFILVEDNPKVNI